MTQKKSRNPHAPYEATKDEVLAFRALQAGEASELQQKKALRVIVHELSRTYDLSFRPDDPHHTTFAEGKRFVGLQIVSILNNPMELKDG